VENIQRLAFRQQLRSYCTAAHVVVVCREVARHLCGLKFVIILDEQQVHAPGHHVLSAPAAKLWV
jgi:hypothetical protein